MKKSIKIIILVCVILIAISIIILFSVLPRKANNNTIVNNTSNRNDVVTKNDDDYVKITYEATSEVFKISGTDKTITIYQDFPTVEADDENVKNKIQAGLGKIASVEFSDYKKQVQDRINDKTDIDASFMENYGNLQIRWTFSNDRNDDKVVSVKNESSGSLGGASWSNKKGYSFSTETGELLELKDIAINTDALKKYINETIIKYFKTNYQELGIYQDSLNKLNEIINIEDCTWYLSNSGLTICIEKYKVSPDTFEYTISYSKLKDLVKDEYLK